MEDQAVSARMPYVEWLVTHVVTQLDPAEASQVPPPTHTHRTASTPCLSPPPVTPLRTPIPTPPPRACA